MVKKGVRILVLTGGGVLGLLTLTAALMTVVRAPAFPFFALGLIAMEWAPWILLLAGVGLLLTALGARAAAWAPGYGLLGLNGLAVLLLGSTWMLAITRPPAVTTNIDALANIDPGSFIWSVFLDNARSEGVGVQRDVVYDRVDGQALSMDVYTPPGHTPDEAVSAIMVVHGGSWRGGDKGEYSEQSEAWAASGYVVFDVAYRLAPQHKFPAAVQDVQCALAFVDSAATSFGVDSGRVALVGRSAGAQIALVAAYAPAALELNPRCPAPANPIRAVVGYYAPTRMSYHDIIQPELSPGALDDYLGGAPEVYPDAYRLARPFTWIGAETPPTLLLHGRKDQFVRIRDPLELGKALASAGRPYAVVLLPWANHGFDYNRTGTNNQRVQPYVDAFLNIYLNPISFK